MYASSSVGVYTTSRWVSKGVMERDGANNQLYLYGAIPTFTLLFNVPPHADGVSTKLAGYYIKKNEKYASFS